MSDGLLKKCPKCKKLSLKRLVGGGAGLIFKGTGFYITDYKKKTGVPKEGGGEAKPATETKSTTTAAPAAPATPAASSGAGKSNGEGAKK